MHLLYLSHCAADAPDKGEKIRVYHFLKQISGRFDVHLVCFTRSEEESRRCTEEWRGRVASVYTEVLHHKSALLKALCRFGLGASVTASYYTSASMRRYLDAAPWKKQIDASLVYSAAMAQYAPPEKPMVLDLCDLDSEKWFEYARLRRPSFAYAMEAKRLRAIEIGAMRRAASTLAMTANERTLMSEVCPDAHIEVVTSGVDLDYWQPGEHKLAHPTVSFVGQLDYFPNVDAALWFSREVMPLLRRLAPDARFAVVGRNPTPEVCNLPSEVEGVDVIPGPPDVRPWLSGATVVAAPIRLARGLQNKVLEALAMGKHVYASEAVCRTFGGTLPRGVVECGSAQDFAQQIAAALREPPAVDDRVRDALRDGYSWAAAGRLLENSIVEAVKR